MVATLIVLLALCLLHAAFLLMRRLEDERVSPRLDREVPAGSLPADPPLVSIVVPARNEEKHLSGCLSSLARQDYGALEVLVVDDRSTDRTGEIAAGFAHRDPRFRVLRGEQTPEGWTGKNHAIHQGAEAARGAFLLIVDADTTLTPGALTQAVAHMEAGGIDLLTLYPRVVIESFWEKALLPWLGVLSAFRMDQVNDPASETAMAFGYFLLFRRTSFDRIGGYASIRDRVGEDWIIARRIKGEGLRLKMLLGSEQVAKRFGPTLQEIWQGFTKNFILIMEGRKWVAALAIPLMLYYLVFTAVPWAILAAAPVLLVLAGWSPAGFLLFVLAAAQICLLSAVRALLRLFIGAEVSAPYLQPVGGVVVSAMGMTAIFRTLTGKGIVWKGRAYRTF